MHPSLAVHPSLVAGDPGGDFPVAAAVFALGLAAVHLSAGRWDFVDPNRRRLFLSAGGGASVAYVFVLILPEVAEAAAVVGAVRGDRLLAEQLVFVVALAGFVTFYGVEVLVAQFGDPDAEGSGLVYWSHVVTFAAYSGVIGYLLFHQEVAGLANLFFYAVAMALHFGVTDYGLYRQHGNAFEDVGKGILAAGTVLGAVLGLFTTVGTYGLSLLFAFVAGSVVFNVVKEELPDITQSRFGAFLFGVLAFLALVLLI